jgi:hypothetical protein
VGGPGLAFETWVFSLQKVVAESGPLTRIRSRHFHPTTATGPSMLFTFEVLGVYSVLT